MGEKSKICPNQPRCERIAEREATLDTLYPVAEPLVTDGISQKFIGITLLIHEINQEIKKGAPKRADICDTCPRTRGISRQ